MLNRLSRVFFIAAVYLIPLLAAAQNKLSIQDPLSNQLLVCTIKGFIGGIYYIGTPIAAVAIGYAGFLFVKARGNVTQLEAAKKTLMWVVLGTGLFLGSWLIGTALLNTIGTVIPGLFKNAASC